MKGPDAEWWDREITGKNWKIANVRKQGRANMGALRALIVPEGVGGPNAGTYVPGSASALDSVDAVNALDTIGNKYIPNHDLAGHDTAWTRGGGCPTTDPINVPRNHANGDGNPIVLPGIRPGQALFWLRTQYPTILKEKRRLNFSSLY